MLRPGPIGRYVGGLAVLGASVALLHTSGCGAPPRRTESSPAPAADLARPAVAMAGLGLEVRGWVVDDRDHRLARAFADLERADALGESGDALWHSCGVRVLDVPTDGLPGFYASLATGPERRLWLGQAARWTEAYGAAEQRTRTGLAMPEGELELQPGTLRLLVRCWVERRIEGAPGAGRERMALRVDLLPQNRERQGNALTLDPIDPTQPLDVGLVFERLRSGWSSDGSRALVLVPAEPDEDWQHLARLVGPIADEPRIFGPTGPKLPTLGEALLGTGREGFRVVLVLIPRTEVGGTTTAGGGPGAR